MAITTVVLPYDCDTMWIIRHELVYFGPIFVGLSSGGPIFGKCSKLNRLYALGLFLVSKILQNLCPFSEYKPRLSSRNAPVPIRIHQVNTQQIRIHV